MLSTGTLLGDTAIYSCGTGYSLQGANTLECLETGWSDNPPTCVMTGELVHTNLLNFDCERSNSVLFKSCSFLSMQPTSSVQ